MTNWKEFFNSYRLVAIRNDQDLLYQVGATVGGKPISDTQFSALIESVGTALRLESSDYVLDLCCGNGIITFEMAKVAKFVTGLDGSESYIKNAEKHKSAANIRYVCCDIRALAELEFHRGQNLYTKVLMYASLAYFTPAELGGILSGLRTVTCEGALIMLGSILDADKKWRFFNTFRRRIVYLVKYRVMGRDGGLGRWWTKSEVENVARRCGYESRFLDQNAILHTAHYRLDAVLMRV